MDIYTKRRLYALLILISIIIFLVMMFSKCSGSNNSKNTAENNEQTIYQVTASNEDIPEVTTTPLVTTSHVRSYDDPENIHYVDAVLEEEDIALINEKYIESMAVVGDSISKGYSVYGRLPQEVVLAKGSVAVRNILNNKFEYGSYELDLLEILKRRKPTYVFTSVGMNDILVSSEEDFVSNYIDFIDKIKEATPDSKIIVMAITPVAYGNDYTSNETIDSYNEALRKMVIESGHEYLYFLNAAKYLKSDNNCLIDELSGGDGIHLSSSAYDTLLSYMFAMMEWI